MAISKRYNDLTDEQLLAKYRSSGDNAWLGVLLERYTLLLLGVALKYLKDKTLAEDAVQQVFVKVLTHLPTGEILNFKGWLYVLMRNHCLQELRDRPKHSDAEVLTELAGNAETTDEHQELELNLDHMNKALELLSEEQKITITLFYLQKQSYEQIISKTGFTFMQVKSFIQNGKRNMKLLLQKKRAK